MSNVKSAFDAPFKTSESTPSRPAERLGFNSTHGRIKPVKRYPLQAQTARQEGAMGEMLNRSTPSEAQTSPVPSAPVRSAFDAPFKTGRKG